MTSGDRMTS